MHVNFGELRDFVCRQCGLYSMIDVIGMECEYDHETGMLYDVIDDSDGRHTGDQVICDCGCAYFDMKVQGRGEQ
ncbi:MAG: hypothetical protein RBR42_09895 [Desulfomicrobium sp.]|nr:hypothetical protein [Desulfomicrobium sp.]NLV95791.1 hypothetical protein [Desulfovibrionales bacterium]